MEIIRLFVIIAVTVGVTFAGPQPVSLACKDPNQCVLKDVRLNAQDQIEFPANFNKNLASTVRNIEFKKSNFLKFPLNFFEVMPNLVGIVARACGLKTLDFYIFGGESYSLVQNIEYLRFEHNQLTNIEANSFSRAHRLRELRLSRNKITTIDRYAFHGMDQLQELDLTHNRLKALDLYTFSPLTSLRMIYLKENEFQTFNLDIFNGNLQLNFAGLTDNSMVDLQASLVNSNLRHIDLRSNELTEISALNKMKGMEMLMLSDNKHLKLNHQTFQDMGQLEHLRMDGTNLQRLNNKYQLFAPLRYLRLLFIGRNGLAGFEVAHLPALPKLYNLGINENNLSFLDADALKVKFPKLGALNINGNQWDCGTLRSLIMKLKSLRIKLQPEGGSKVQTTMSQNVDGVGCEEHGGFVFQQTQPQSVPPTETQSFQIDVRKKPLTDAQVCGKPTLQGSQFIYGGQKAVRGAWPWLVAMNKVDKNIVKYICGATLISEKIVISAAHCVTAITVDQTLLYIGRHDIKSVLNTDDYQERGAQQLICHPDYYNTDRSFSDADVALVIMNAPVSYTKNILPICLWPTSMANENVVAKRGIVAGWGRDERGASATSEPHAVELPLVSSAQCLQEDISYFYITSNRTLCAGEKNGDGPCNGDSGSGFVMKQGGKWVLRGIVSAGLPDPVKQTCDLTKYVVLSDVTKFNDWILSYLTI